MFYKYIAIFAIAATALTTTLAQPQGPPQRPHDRQRPGEGFIKKLNLTDAQELQMKKLRIDLMKKQTQLHSRIQTLRLGTKELFLAEKLDRSAMEKNIKGISDAQQEIKLNLLDHWFAVNTILTPEQQKTWRNVPMELEKKMRHRGRRMMGHDERGQDFH